MSLSCKHSIICRKIKDPVSCRVWWVICYIFLQDYSEAEVYYLLVSHLRIGNVMNWQKVAKWVFESKNKTDVQEVRIKNLYFRTDKLVQKGKVCVH